jgi:gluconate 2-dehydrogenase alpha chain
MATNLKKTDVVIVGLGAVGGVAALPLARAGLEVVGLEAGSWLTERDFAPDELRNNFRGWPQSAQKANSEIPTHRPNASAPYSPRLPIHPMMNAVGGTSLHYWAQSWRLNPWDFKVVSETRRRYGASRIPKGSTVEDWPFGLEELEPYYDKVEYEVGVSGQAGNINGRDRPARQHLRGSAPARLSDAGAARHGVHRQDGNRGREARLASVPGPGGDQLTGL